MRNPLKKQRDENDGSTVYRLTSSDNPACVKQSSPVSNDHQALHEGATLTLPRGFEAISKALQDLHAQQQRDFEAQLNTQQTKYENMLSDQRDQFTQMQDDLDAAREKAQVDNHEIKQLKSHLHELTDDLQKERESQACYQEKIEKLQLIENRTASLESEKQRLETKLATIQSSHQTHEAMKAQLHKNIRELESELQAAKEDQQTRIEIANLGVVFGALSS